MSAWQIITQHIAPNSVNVVIVYSSLLVLEAILTESFLSYLGIGVAPPFASWGSLIDEGAARIETDMRLLLLPGGFLAAVLFCITALLPGVARADNPSVQHIYTADPAPLVYNGRVYLYTGHDEDNSTYFTMRDWRVWSSSDMVNWTDHGSPMSLAMRMRLCPSQTET